MDRQQAIKILKNTGYIGNEVGVAFDVAIKSMDKLDKIEQIMSEFENTKTECEEDFDYLCRIAEVLEKE